MIVVNESDVASQLPRPGRHGTIVPTACLKGATQSDPSAADRPTGSTARESMFRFLRRFIISDNVGDGGSELLAALTTVSRCEAPATDITLEFFDAKTTLSLHSSRLRGWLTADLTATSGSSLSFMNAATIAELQRDFPSQLSDSEIDLLHSALRIAREVMKDSCATSDELCFGGFGAAQKSPVRVHVAAVVESMLVRVILWESLRRIVTFGGCASQEWNFELRNLLFCVGMTPLRTSAQWASDVERHRHVVMLKALLVSGDRFGEQSWNIEWPRCVGATSKRFLTALLLETLPLPVICVHIAPQIVLRESAEPVVEDNGQMLSALVERLRTDATLATHLQGIERLLQPFARSTCFCSLCVVTLVLSTVEAFEKCKPRVSPSHSRFLCINTILPILGAFGKDLLFDQRSLSPGKRSLFAAQLRLVGAETLLSFCNCVASHATTTLELQSSSNVDRLGALLVRVEECLTLYYALCAVHALVPHAREGAPMKLHETEKRLISSLDELRAMVAEDSSDTCHRRIMPLMEHLELFFGGSFPNVCEPNGGLVMSQLRVSARQWMSLSLSTSLYITFELLRSLWSKSIGIADSENELQEFIDVLSRYSIKYLIGPPGSCLRGPSSFSDVVLRLAALIKATSLKEPQGSDAATAADSPTLLSNNSLLNLCSYFVARVLSTGDAFHCIIDEFAPQVDVIVKVVESSLVAPLSTATDELMLFPLVALLARLELLPLSSPVVRGTLIRGMLAAQSDALFDLTQLDAFPNHKEFLSLQSVQFDAALHLGTSLVEHLIKHRHDNVATTDSEVGAISKVIRFVLWCGVSQCKPFIVSEKQSFLFLKLLSNFKIYRVAVSKGGGILPPSLDAMLSAMQLARKQFLLCVTEMASINCSSRRSENIQQLTLHYWAALVALDVEERKLLLAATHEERNVSLLVDGEDPEVIAKKRFDTENALQCPLQRLFVKLVRSSLSMLGIMTPSARRRRAITCPLCPHSLEALVAMLTLVAPYLRLVLVDLAAVLELLSFVLHENVVVSELSNEQLKSLCRIHEMAVVHSVTFGGLIFEHVAFQLFRRIERSDLKERRALRNFLVAIHFRIASISANSRKVLPKSEDTSGDTSTERCEENSPSNDETVGKTFGFRVRVSIIEHASMILDDTAAIIFSSPPSAAATQDDICCLLCYVLHTIALSRVPMETLALQRLVVHLSAISCQLGHQWSAGAVWHSAAALSRFHELDSLSLQRTMDSFDIDLASELHRMVRTAILIFVKVNLCSRESLRKLGEELAVAPVPIGQTISDYFDGLLLHMSNVFVGDQDLWFKIGQHVRGCQAVAEGSPEVMEVAASLQRAMKAAGLWQGE